MRKNGPVSDRFSNRNDPPGPFLSLNLLWHGILKNQMVKMKKSKSCRRSLDILERKLIVHRIIDQHGAVPDSTGCAACRLHAEDDRLPR